MAIPKTLCQGRYRVKQVLGQSEHSKVYECFDPDSEERVAIKVLSVATKHPEIVREMYKREVGALDGFTHDFLVRMHRFEAEEDEGRLNIVLELIAGGQTLEQLITGAASLPIAFSLRWRLEQLLGLLQVIDRAHGRGIIHRDVKLSNVLVDRELQRLKLADFGIARVLENYGRTAGGATLREFYTRPFAAPEQVLGQDTSFPADLHAFGVVAASVLAWRLPDSSFSESTISAFLVPFLEGMALVGFADDQRRGAIVTKLPDVLRRLVLPDPGARPRIAEVELALREALDATIERHALRVILTHAARDKAKLVGLAGGSELLAELNDGLRVAYEPDRDGRPWSITCLGRRGQGRLVEAQDEPGKLKMVDYVAPHPADLARRREQAATAPFLLVEGEGSGQTLIDFVWEDHQKQLAENQLRESRESLLDLARFVLAKQRERMEMIRVRYRFEGDDEPVLRPAALAPWQQQLAAQRTSVPEVSAPPPAPRPVEMRAAEGEVVSLRVLSVQMGRQADVGDATMLDDSIPPEWESNLGYDSTFAHKGKDFATAYGYDPATKILRLKLRRRVTLPALGEIQCEDVATRTALDRQDAAISAFLDDEAVNPRLSHLLLHPDQNTLDEQQPVDLVQRLEPTDASTDIVSRALAARDFFLVQGPPGTGKTTLITEIMTQILQRDPSARVLLTSQANEAVNNALDSLRQMDKQLGGRWRLVRDQRAQPGRPVGFDLAFKDWAERTALASAEAEKSLTDEMPDERRRNVVDALQNWREKLQYIPDAKVDYAGAVQVWGMTLLRVPALWKLLPEVHFDYVIIDEAARATPAELLVALVAGRRFILVGDHRQLPPFLDTETIDDLKAADLDVDRARKPFFEELFERVGDRNKTTLRRQFRMHRSISDLVGALYYPDIGLETGVSDDERRLDLKRYGGPNRVFWLDVTDGRERQTKDSTSWWNHEEVVAIEGALAEMEQELRTSGVEYTVGVIAAYVDQREKLRERIRPESTQRWKALRIRIDTVDAFQGKQDDLIFYSNVRANTGELRFVSDGRRLNVAFSRAKRLLILVGHRETAVESPQIAAVINRIPAPNVIAVKEAR